jgi:trimethylamine---corrinoid protein Co-methyltransferase
MDTSHLLDLPDSFYTRLSSEQQNQIKDASFEILERVGACLYDQDALDLLKHAGVKIEDGNRAFLPQDLVEKTLAMAPDRFILFNRSGIPALPVKGHRTFFGPGSDCLHIIDHRTGERRAPVLRDVVEGVIVCDGLDNIDFLMSLFLPVDVKSEIADRYQMQAMLNYTTKSVIFVTYELSGCIDAIKMAELVAGGSHELMERPFVVCYLNPTTGLRHNKEVLQKLLFMAGKGLPVIYIPGATAGAAVPATVAASNAMRLAGSLVGLVLAQLKREGTPIIIPGWGALAMDMRSAVQIYTGPDHQGVAQAMAHRLELPMLALGGATDAKIIDQQAGIEAALTLLFDAVVGSQLVHDVGYLESGLTGSLAQIVICNEIITWVKRALQPVDISSETLALDLIQDTGPDGQYLDKKHTLRHFKDQWHPLLFDRSNYEGWVKRGSQTLAERAAERVGEILNQHTPDPLPDKVKVEIQKIVENPTHRV